MTHVQDDLADGSYVVYFLCGDNAAPTPWERIDYYNWAIEGPGLPLTPTHPPVEFTIDASPESACTGSVCLG